MPQNLIDCLILLRWSKNLISAWYCLSKGRIQYKLGYSPVYDPGSEFMVPGCDFLCLLNLFIWIITLYESIHFMVSYLTLPILFALKGRGNPFHFERIIYCVLGFKKIIYFLLVYGFFDKHQLSFNKRIGPPS